MFDRIAGVYDLMNTAMTAGMHHAGASAPPSAPSSSRGDSALDVCCGTGDLALELARRVGADGAVVGCDFSERMLELARAQGRRARAWPRSSSSGRTRSTFPTATRRSTRSPSASGCATSPTSSVGSPR